MPSIQSKTRDDFDSKILRRALKATACDLLIALSIGLPLAVAVIALTGGWE